MFWRKCPYCKGRNLYLKRTSPAEVYGCRDCEKKVDLTSDIADILQGEYNELTTLLIQQRDLINICMFHKMYPARCTDKIQVFENREQYMKFVRLQVEIEKLLNSCI